MPIKFVIEENANSVAATERFDKMMLKMKVPTILLERLYGEFDESNK